MAGADIDFTLTPPNNGASISKIELFNGNTLLTTLSSPPYVYQWNAVPIGSYPISAKVTYSNAKTLTSSPIVVVVHAAPSINISSPLNNASINDDRVQIAGTVQAPPNSSVEINGEFAKVTQDGHFYFNNFPLNAGSNTLIATVSSIQGVSATQTISVTSTGQAPFTLNMSEDTALGASLSTTINLTARTTTPYKKMLASCAEGAAPTTFAAADSVFCNYTQAGSYKVTVSAITQVGTEPEKVAYTDTQMVYLASVPALNQLLQGVYSQLKTKLRLGNIPQAANLFSGGVREQYTQMFSNIPNLSNMVNSMGDIKTNMLNDSFAEYLLIQEKNAVKYAYPLYFSKSKDGIWRIEGF